MRKAMLALWLLAAPCGACCAPAPARAPLPPGPRYEILRPTPVGEGTYHLPPLPPLPVESRSPEMTAWLEALGRDKIQQDGWIQAVRASHDATP